MGIYIGHLYRVLGVKFKRFLFCTKQYSRTVSTNTAQELFPQNKI